VSICIQEFDIITLVGTEKTDLEESYHFWKRRRSISLVGHKDKENKIQAAAFKEYVHGPGPNMFTDRLKQSKSLKIGQHI
jgi:hypothetical protein